MISWKGGQTIQVLLATLGAGCLVGFRQGLEDGPELAVLVVSIAIYGWYPHGKSTSPHLLDAISRSMFDVAPMNV